MTITEILIAIFIGALLVTIALFWKLSRILNENPW